jgi:8-oxo-dGTP pyrophosphatase MutT (NUDIX family)
MAQASLAPSYPRLWLFTLWLYITAYTIDMVRAALALPEFDTTAAHQRMLPLARTGQRPAETPGEPRLGGVLLLLYCHSNELYLVLTRRHDDLNAHAGQISFPGGRREPNETMPAAALRETYEEIGVPPTAVTLLGELTPVYIPPSDFEVHPFVGWFHSRQRPAFTPAASEVAEILEVSLSHLLDPATQKKGPWTFRGLELIVPYFDVDGYQVWGATAIMLSEFLERLRAVTASAA